MALLPARSPKRMKTVYGFQSRGRVRKRERDFAGASASNVC
jgi:hypothetical protein